MKHYIEGKVIVITGGSSGFGYEAARMLLEMGAMVTITGRNAERFEKAEKDLGGGENLLSVQSDACVTEEWKKLVAEVTNRWGTIDVLVLNHGQGVKIANIEDMDDKSIQQIMDINIIIYYEHMLHRYMAFECGFDGVHPILWRFFPNANRTM